MCTTPWNGHKSKTKLVGSSIWRLTQRLEHTQTAGVASVTSSNRQRPPDVAVCPVLPVAVPLMMVSAATDLLLMKWLSTRKRAKSSTASNCRFSTFWAHSHTKSHAADWTSSLTPLSCPGDSVSICSHKYKTNPSYRTYDAGYVSCVCVYDTSDMCLRHLLFYVDPGWVKTGSEQTASSSVRCNNMYAGVKNTNFSYNWTLVFSNRKCTFELFHNNNNPGAIHWVGSCPLSETNSQISPEGQDHTIPASVLCCCCSAAAEGTFHFTSIFRELMNCSSRWSAIRDARWDNPFP